MSATQSQHWLFSIQKFSIATIKWVHGDVPSGFFESQTLKTDLFHYVPDLTESHHIIDVPQAGHVGNPARWNIMLPKFLSQILPAREQLCWKIPIHVLLYLKMPS